MSAQVFSTDLLSVRALPNGHLVEFNCQELEESNSAGLREELFSASAEAAGRTLYLNFNRVRVVTQAIWLQIISLNEALQNDGRRLCLLNLAPELSTQFHALERNSSEAPNRFQGYELPG